MNRLRPVSLRIRLTRWYVAALAAMLLLFIGTSSIVMFWQLRSQLYRYMIDDLETVEGLLYYTADGNLQLHNDYHGHPQSQNVEERFLQVASPDGAVLFRNEKLGNQSLGMLVSTSGNGYTERAGRLSDGTRVLAVSHLHLFKGRPMIICVAYPEEPILARITETVAALLLSLPLMLVLAAWAGVKLAGQALDPLGKMAAQAERINADNLHERLPVDETGEIGQLAKAFNNTLSRLEHSFEQLRRFTSDASHELRTPLAAIRSVGEVGLQAGRSSGEYREIIGSMLEEVNQLSRLVDSLLAISRADAGEVELHASTLPVFDVLREAVGLIEILAEEKDQKLILAGDERLLVLADPLLLRQALVNLLHNAVKYSPASGSISATVLSDGVRVFVDIVDTGPGMPEEDREKVFDRFYRVDQARSRDEGGAGLGLSIAKWAIQAQGGEIHVTNNASGGCTFRVELPLQRNSFKFLDHGTDQNLRVTTTASSDRQELGLGWGLEPRNNRG